LLIAELRNNMTGTIFPEGINEEDWLSTDPPTASSQPSSVAEVIQAAATLSTKKESGEAPRKTKTVPKSWLTRTGRTPEEEMKFDTQELRTVQFGKHQGKSYELMMVEFPGYCDWVIKTNQMEPEACASLKHSATYLLTKGHGGRKVYMTEEPGTPTATTKASSSSQPSTRVDH
jgi:hypothetical protein